MYDSDVTTDWAAYPFIATAFKDKKIFTEAAFM